MTEEEFDLHRAEALINRLMKPTFVAQMARGRLTPGLKEHQKGAAKRYLNALREIDQIAKELYGQDTKRQ